MQRPGVGMGVLVLKDGKLLYHRRKSGAGEGTWSFPGGHLEFGESIQDCAKHETLEETGIKIDNVRFLCITNDVFKDEKKHYLTIFVAGDYVSGEPKASEESYEVGWFDFENQPEPLFSPVEKLFDNRCFPSNWKDNIGLVV